MKKIIIIVAVVVFVGFMIHSCAGQHYYLRGVYAYQKGDYEQAIVYLEKSKKISGVKFPSIYFYLGKSYQAIADNVSARRNYEETVKIIRSDESYLKEPTLQPQLREAEQYLGY